MDIGSHDLLGGKEMARALIISMALLLLSVSAAAAKLVCGPYPDITGRLQAEYKESAIGRGIDNSGYRIFEVWAGPNGWSILMTDARMTTCIMAIGQKGTTWEQLDPLPGAGQAGSNSWSWMPGSY